MSYVTAEPAAIVDYGPNTLFNPASLGQYRLLKAHYLVSGWFDVDTIVTEGREIPFGWVPTLGVDPLNATAVQNFWNVGPRSYATYEDVNEFENATKSKSMPVTYWKQVSGTKTYVLTGLGTGFPPKGP